jgi:hypothetical protein
MNVYYYLAIFTTVATLVFTYLGTSYESKKSNNDIVDRLTQKTNKKQGLVKGQLILEDQADPSSASIFFFKNGEKIREIHPNVQGEFLTALEEGQYSINISKNGYETLEIDNIIALEGTRNIGDITLSVSSKNISIVFTDKSGSPYPNLELALMKGLPPTHSTFYKTNENGKMTINDLDYGTYNFSIGKETVTQSGFLWVIDKERYIPSFELKASEEKYNIILPKVKLSDLSKSNNSPHFVPANIRYFAQAINVLEPITFSGLGIGLGLNGVGSPSILELRNNENDLPGNNIIFQENPYKYGATISIKLYDTPNESPNISSTGSFAHSLKTHNLEKGLYWIVAKYESIPEKINILGGSNKPSSGLEVLSSSDGKNWESPPLPRGWKMLDIFLVE